MEYREHRNLIHILLATLCICTVAGLNTKNLIADENKEDTVLKEDKISNKEEALELEDKTDKNKAKLKWEFDKATNNWIYYEDNKPVPNKWVATKDGWYYTDTNGIMITEPTLIDGKWEYFDRFGKWFDGYSSPKIVYEQGIDWEEAKQIVAELQSLPDYLKYNIKEVRFTPNSLEEEFNLSRAGTIAGVTYDNNKIVFRTGTGIKIPDLAKHEALHVYSNMEWQDSSGIYFEKMVDMCDEWEKLMEQEGNAISVSIYNQRNTHEIFVEAALNYFNKPEELKRIAPNIYKFLDRKVFIYK